MLYMEIYHGILNLKVLYKLKMDIQQTMLVGFHHRFFTFHLNLNSGRHRLLFPQIMNAI